MRESTATASRVFQCNVPVALCVAPDVIFLEVDFTVQGLAVFKSLGPKFRQLRTL